MHWSRAYALGRGNTSSCRRKAAWSAASCSLVGSDDPVSCMKLFRTCPSRRRGECHVILASERLECLNCPVSLSPPLKKTRKREKIYNKDTTPIQMFKAQMPRRQQRQELQVVQERTKNGTAATMVEHSDSSKAIASDLTHEAPHGAISGYMICNIMWTRTHNAPHLDCGRPR